MPDLTDVAFITGGARGLGRAFGQALCERGAKVVLADIDVDTARTAAKELKAAGHTAVALNCDVADEDQVGRAVDEAVAEFGGIDVLINNAGRHLLKYNRPFSEVARDELRGLFEVNVIGIVNCTLACVEPMKIRGGGAVVNISSMASYSPASPYGVSKLAVRGLTIAFAKELADAGIRVNAISPGLTATESAIDDLPQETVEEIVNDQQLIHRLGGVDDIVNAMLFLCSDEASFITGETLKVSGGTPLSI